MVPTIPDKIFGTKWSNSAKLDRKKILVSVFGNTGICGLWTQVFWALYSGCWTVDAGLWTLDSEHWTLDAGLRTLLLTGSEQNQNPVSDSS